MYRFPTNESYTTKYAVRLGGVKDIYALWITEDKENLQTQIDIFKSEASTNTLEKIYSEVLKGITGVKFYNLPWNLTESFTLVLYSLPLGSGSFLTYEILGVENGIVKKLGEEEGIFQGSVFFQGNQLIRGSGNQFRVWDKVNDAFILEPYRMPVYPRAKLIRYSIVDDVTVNIAESSYEIKAGSIIQLLREDFNNSVERTLISSKEGCIDFIKPSVFKINCRTKVIITIIPDGYNWNGAKEITINVI